MYSTMHKNKQRYKRVRVSSVFSPLYYAISLAIFLRDLEVMKLFCGATGSCVWSS